VQVVTLNLDKYPGILYMVVGLLSSLLLLLLAMIIAKVATH